MVQPVPEYPTNVQSNNPYVGIDRGLFLLRGVDAGKYARIHAARWVTKGPIAGLGLLEYQIMRYENKPTTLDELQAGTLLISPDGTPWFDCLTRGLVATPIQAEYWGMNSYFANYASGGQKLSTEEKTTAETQAVAFTSTVGRIAGVTGIDYELSFGSAGGEPISIISKSLTIDYTVNGVANQVITSSPPDLPEDPVHKAIAYIKSL